MTIGTPITRKSSRHAAWSFSCGTFNEPTYVLRTVAAREIVSSITCCPRLMISSALTKASPENSMSYSWSSSNDSASCRGVSTYSVLGSIDSRRRSVASRSVPSGSPSGLSSVITASSSIAHDSLSSISAAASSASERARSSASSAAASELMATGAGGSLSAGRCPMAASASSVFRLPFESSSSSVERHVSGSSVSSSGDPRDARVISSTHSSYRLCRYATCEENRDMYRMLRTTAALARSRGVADGLCGSACRMGGVGASRVFSQICDTGSRNRCAYCSSSRSLDKRIARLSS